MTSSLSKTAALNKPPRSFWISQPESLYWLALFALCGIGLALRLIDLGQLPAGLYRDEAMNALDGLTAVSSGRFPLYFADNYGRGLFQEGLFVNLQGITSFLLGPSALAARLPAALIGAVGIISVAFMARQLFASRTLALIAAGLLAFSYWGINFSRIGFSAILVPTTLALAVGLLVWANRSSSVLRVLGAGAFFGLGVYTYAAYRFAPLLAVVILTATWWILRWPLQKGIRFASAFALGATLTSLPFLLAIWREPRILTARAQDVSLLSANLPAAEILERLLTNLSLATGKFFFLGDINIRHNYGPYGVLSPLVALLFAAGIFMCVLWIASYIRNGRRVGHASEYALGSVVALSGIIIMTLPEVLSADSVPHSLRSIGSQPFVMTLAAVPVWIIIRQIRNPDSTKKAGTRWVAGILALLLASAATFDMYRYFVAFRTSEEQRIAFDADLQTMLVQAGEEGVGTLLLPYPQQQAVIRYLNRDGTYPLKLIQGLDDVQLGHPVWLRESDRELLEELSRQHPQLQVSLEGGDEPPTYLEVLVPQK